MAAQVWAMIFAVVAALIPPIKRLWMRGDEMIESARVASSAMRGDSAEHNVEQQFLDVLRQEKKP